jgi:hypothetical protein
LPYAVTFIKIESASHDLVSSSLSEVSKNIKLNELHVEIQLVLLSVGYPDFILILRGPNIELLKKALLFIRNELGKKGVKGVETSTVVGLTIEEMALKEYEIKHPK